MQSRIKGGLFQGVDFLAVLYYLLLVAAGCICITAASFDDSKLSSMEQVNYIGAFDANNNWLEGWTEFDPQNADY